MTDTPEPAEVPRSRDRRRSFLANVAGKLVLVLLAGLGLILLFRGCVEPMVRRDVGEVQQKHHEGAR
jgi:hypothetical protein